MLILLSLSLPAEAGTFLVCPRGTSPAVRSECGCLGATADSDLWWGGVVANAELDTKPGYLPKGTCFELSAYSTGLIALNQARLRIKGKTIASSQKAEWQWTLPPERIMWEDNEESCNDPFLVLPQGPGEFEVIDTSTGEVISRILSDVPVSRVDIGDFDEDGHDDLLFALDDGGVFESTGPIPPVIAPED